MLEESLPKPMKLWVGNYRVLRGGVPKGRGELGNPEDSQGRLGNIGED